MPAVLINGNDLTFEALQQVVDARQHVELAPAARVAVERARAVVDELVTSDRVAYAITTGVGRLADVRISAHEARELQINLVRSHAVGVGEPLGEAASRAMMLLRANSLSKGFSGVRPIVIDTLCEMLNRGVHPVIPSQGSVGASGDLAPLAHQALVLVGEGEAIFKGKRLPGADALKAAGIAPIQLEAKDAISLINGTQAMLAVGVLAVLACEILCDTADVIGSITLDALQGTDVAFDERIHRARPHAGQLAVAANLRELMRGSQLRERHRDCTRVQDAYSLRCMPQVHGAVRDALAFARRTFEIEMNSAVDNPLVFPSEKKDGARAEGDVLSGGNFHGEPLAFALDFIGIVLCAVAGISERRIERLVNPQLNEGLPAFLVADAGLNSGFMMPQVTAAALVSENKVLAHPASVDSITTSGNKEDYVSMGMTAALKLQRIIANTTSVLAIEALAAAQAVDLLAPLKPSARAQRALAEVRAVSPMLTHDRSLAADFAKVAAVIADGKIALALR